MALNPLTVGTRRYFLATVIEGSIRVRWDGGNPTATVGHVVTAGAAIELNSR